MADERGEDDEEARELGRQAQAAALRLLREGGVNPRLIVLAVPRDS